MSVRRKRFGQHFLEPAWVAKIVDALGDVSGDTCLEIGPGRGALTVPLASRAHRVIGVEIDRDLAGSLAHRSIPNLRVVSSNILDVDFEDLLRGERLPVRVVGNLPYNIASPILFALLAAAGNGSTFSDETVMIQKEVADRLVAMPGRKDYGVLAVQMAIGADVERLFTLPPGAFRPPPTVMSAVIRLRFRPPTVEVGDPRTFERVVRGLFLQRRKTVANALRPVAESLGRESTQWLARAG